MDRRLEPLNRYDALAAFVFGVGFFVPLAATLAQAALDFRQWDPGGVFFEVLVRSLVFTASQAFLSAAVACALGLAAGVCSAFVPGALGAFAARAMEGLGLLTFVLPGIAVALLVLDVGAFFSWFPREGLAALVAAHAFLNAPLIAASVGARTRAWLAGGGREELESAMLLGAPLRAVAPRLLRPLAIAEARAWFPLVFFWSASNFATLLILGGTRGRTSPEVLLFYSLLNDTDSGRLFTLMVVSMLFALAGWRFAVRGGVSWQQSVATRVAGGDGLARSGPGVRAALGLFLAAFTAPLAWLFAVPAMNLAAAGFAGFRDLLNTLARTVALGTYAALFTYAGAWILLRAGSTSRRIAAGLLGCSSTLVGAAWVGVGADLWVGAAAGAQILLAAAALALVQLPLAALWIESRLGSLPAAWFESACLLGAPVGSAKSRLAFPLFRDLFWRLTVMSFLAAFGEIALTSLFVRDTETLAQAARRLAQRYDFSGSAWILLAMGSAAVLATLALALAQTPRGREDRTPL